MKTLFLIGGMGPRILTIYGMKVCLRSPGTGDHIWEVQEISHPSDDTVIFEG